MGRCFLRYTVRRRAGDKHRHIGPATRFTKTRELRGIRDMRHLLAPRCTDGVRRWYLPVHADGLEHRCLGDTIDRHCRGRRGRLVLRLQQIPA